MFDTIDWVYNQFMGRKSLKDQRRAEIVRAFGRVLASHGYAGATVQAVAEEANLAPGLLHHYFSGKEEMLHELFASLVKGFRQRMARGDAGSGLEGYLGAALSRGEGADPQAAKCWVGLFAEAMRDPVLLAKFRRFLEGEIALLCEKSGGRLETQECSSLLAYVLGCLVFGAFAPKKAEGFAFSGGRKLLAALDPG